MGQALAELRRSWGLTQKEVAARVSTYYSDERAYRRVERGERLPDRDNVIAIVTVGLGVVSPETINRLLVLAGYADLTEAEARSLNPAPVTVPTPPLIVPQKAGARSWLGTDGRKRLVAVVVSFLIVSGAIASTSPHAVIVMLTSALYGCLYAVSVLLESAFGTSNGKAARAGTRVFCLMLLTSVLALAADEWLVEAGGSTALSVSLSVFVLSAGFQWLWVKRVLPESVIVPSRFQAHTAQAAHLKNTAYFLLIVVLFWLPPVHCISVLRREIRLGHADLARNMLGGWVIIGPDVVCLNVACLWGLFLLLLLLAIPMSAWLLNNLKPHPKTNTYINLLYLRAFLYFLLILVCLIWFSSSLGSLPH